MAIKLIPTDISDVQIIEPKVFGDDRGWFLNHLMSKIFVLH